MSSSSSGPGARASFPGRPRLVRAFLPLLLLFAVRVSAGVPVEWQFGYDDGGFEGYVLSDTSSVAAVRFTPPAYPCTLVSCSVALSWIAFPGPFEVAVYDDDGADGSPGTLLGKPAEEEGLWSTWWATLFGGDLPIVIDEGDFFIAWYETWPAGEGWGLRVDTSDPDEGRSWRREAGEWSAESGRDFAIRAGIRFDYPSGWSRSWAVDAAGGGDAPTIAAALESSYVGDTILVSPGVYREHDLEMSWGAYLLGEGGDSSAVVIDAGGLGAAILCDTGLATTRIEGVTVTGGRAERGGAIRVRESSPTISRCAFAGSEADDGGALLCENGAPRFVGCAFLENVARYTGGAVRAGEGAEPVFEGCLFEGNASALRLARPAVDPVDPWGGGAIAYRDGAAPSFLSCEILGNRTGFWGGGVSGKAGGARFADTRIAGNEAGRGGGGVHADASAQEMEECLLAGNLAALGGALYAGEGSAARLFSCTVASNRALEKGGGAYLHLDGTIEGEKTILYGNAAPVAAEGNDLYLGGAGAGASFDCAVVDSSGVRGEGAASYGPDVFFDDPLFCDAARPADAPAAQGEYTIDFLSPAWNEPGCGLIGAFPAACRFHVRPEPGRIDDPAAAWRIDTLRVYPDGTGDHPTIRAAVEAAAGGDVIVLADGIFTGEGNRDVDLLGKAVHIRSAGGDPDLCVIDCGGTEAEPHRAFIFKTGEDRETVIEGIGVRLGYGPDDGPDDRSAGGAIGCFAASPTIRGCAFIRNRANYAGGAIYLEDGSPFIEDCYFHRDSSRSSGGVIYGRLASAPEIVTCHFEGNYADDWGGTAFFRDAAEPRFDRCRFNGNRGRREAGAVYLRDSCEAVLDSCVLISNQGREGGAITVGGSCEARIAGCRFDWNWAREGSGGGIRATDSRAHIELEDCRFTNNIAQAHGGGVLLGARNHTVRCVFTENRAVSRGGGAVFRRGRIEECVFQDNSATHGGGMELGGGTVQVTDCVIAGNRASEDGGGVWTMDEPFLERCVIRGNEADWEEQGNGDGGGIYAQSNADVHLKDCLIEENTTPQAGGGMATTLYSSPVIEGCVFRGNRAGNGGGLWLYSDSEAAIRECRFLENEAHDGAGLYLGNDADAEVEGCLFDGNSAESNGGGIHVNSSDPDIGNCTFVRNGAAGMGGGVHTRGSSRTTFRNGIIWGSEAGGAFTRVSGSATIACSDFYGNDGGDWTEGILEQAGLDSNISIDPLFCRPEEGDFRLDIASPLLDFPSCRRIGAFGAGCDGDRVWSEEEGSPRDGAAREVTSVLAGIEPPRLFAFPNPSRGGVTIRFAGRNASPASVRVYDVTGRLVRAFETGGGEGSLVWDGRDLRGRSVSPGVYFIRARDAAGTRTARVILLR